MPQARQLPTDAETAGSALDDATAADGPDRPIFVMGCARSGTTLLQLMLHSHPRIAIPPETRFIEELYQRRERFGNLRRRKNRRKLARAIIGKRRRKFHDLGLDAAQVKARIVNGPPTIGSAMGIVLREYARRFDKPRWGDKRPAYIKHPEVILAMFPDAQLVHIIRDGRACVASLKRMPWWKHGSIAAMAKWVEAINKGHWARSNLRPDQYYELQYEHLVADPRGELQRLCDFLGETFDEAMLEPSRVAGEAVPDKKTWHTRTRGEVTTAAVNQWASELEPWEVALMERVAGRMLRAYGYPLTAGRSRPPVSKRRRYLEISGRRRAADVRWRQKERALEGRYPYPVAARLTKGQRQAAAAERRRRREA
ncbi:MAG: sulfotransferase [Actinomycetota bacterium]|nr:sulfotransferase [Actinomycetota bacterium]